MLYSSKTLLRGDFKIDNHHHSCILFLLKGNTDILQRVSRSAHRWRAHGSLPKTILIKAKAWQKQNLYYCSSTIKSIFTVKCRLNCLPFILSLKRVVFIPYLSVLRYDMCWTVFASISNRKFSAVICMNWNRKRYSWYSVHSTIEQIWPTSWCPSQGEIRISKVSYWKTTCRYETSNSLHNYIIVPNVLSIVNSKAAFTILPTIGFLIKNTPY